MTSRNVSRGTSPSGSALGIELTCAICGRALLPGETFVIVTRAGLGFLLCRPSTSIDCLAELLDAVPPADGFAFRFLDPAAAHQLDDAIQVDDGRWRN